MIGSWWARRPERLAAELSALDAAGLAYELIAAEGGAPLRIAVTVDGPSHPVDLLVTFPDGYPYFKPYVAASKLGFAHHWNPVTGEVCLLDGNEDWRPASDTLAGLLTEQWASLLALNAEGGAPATATEAEQAEPVSAYVEPQSGSFLSIGSSESPGSVLGRASVHLSSLEPVHGHITHLQLADGAVAYTADLVMPDPILSLEAVWIGLPDSPADLTPAGVLEAVLTEHPEADNEGWTPVTPTATRGNARALLRHVQLLLISIPEETARRETGRGWLAVTRTRASMRVPPGAPHLIRVGRAGRKDLLVRAPELQALPDKRVAVFGLGGLGSSVAHELSRLPLAQLLVADRDTVDPACAIRAIGGFRFAGQTKVAAAAALAVENQPYTLIAQFQGSIGGPRLAIQERDSHALLHEELGPCDLVIDCTADTAVQHYLSDLARGLGVAYLQVEATSGVHGGLIALHRPEADACWSCLQWHLTTRTVTAPPRLEAKGIQPPGCGSPTYPGTGFDLAQVASMATRMACAFLTGDSGYGSFDRDWCTVALRSADGVPILPTWSAWPTERHPQCANHV